jgi:protein-S-isoprenylcysteine O-methyltransferase Ste14
MNIKPKMIAWYFVDEVVSIFAMGVALFWSAGRLDWWAAWAAIAVQLVCMTALGIVILRFQPDLMEERLKPPKGAKAWDRTIMSLMRLTQLARYIIAGLDQRYGWTAGFPVSIQIAACLGCVLGFALLEWALANNAFFSQIVRIQSERGHTVARGGPYRFVRHPGYLGMVLFELAMPTLLDSGWALLVSGGCALLWTVRTALEDRTLQAELPGYAAYARQVRYRLLPGIW